MPQEKTRKILAKTLPSLITQSPAFRRKLGFFNFWIFWPLLVFLRDFFSNLKTKSWFKNYIGISRYRDVTICAPVHTSSSRYIARLRYVACAKNMPNLFCRQTLLIPAIVADILHTSKQHLHSPKRNHGHEQTTINNC